MRSWTPASHGRPAARSSSAMSAPADSAAVSSRSRPGSEDPRDRPALASEFVQRVRQGDRPDRPGSAPASSHSNRAGARTSVAEAEATSHSTARAERRGVGDEPGSPQDRVAQPQVVAARQPHPCGQESRIPGGGVAPHPPGRRSRPPSRSPMSRSAGVVRFRRRQLMGVGVQQRGLDPVVRPAEDDPGRAFSPVRRRDHVGSSHRGPSPRWLRHPPSCCRDCGTHSNTTSRPAISDCARWASTCMSGCLIFQRPDICSTTSFESRRTRTDAAGVALEGRLQPRDHAAVLRHIVACDADVDAELGEDRPAVRVDDHGTSGRDARVPPGSPIGFDDEATRHSPESSPRTRMQPHSGHVTIWSSAAWRMTCRSVPASTMRHPSQVRRTSMAAPELRTATRP